MNNKKETHKRNKKNQIKKIKKQKHTKQNSSIQKVVTQY
jgi:hypothetical protein